MPTEMRGSLTRNENRKDDKSPEFKGSALINGVEFWVNAWVRENDGRKYFSLSFREKEAPKTETRPASGSPELQAKYNPNTNGRPAYSPRQQLDDEIPFAPEWR
jgi:hypothetical protein